MKTSILMVVNNLSNGGIERVVVNIACKLNPKLFDVYVFSAGDNDYYKDLLVEHSVTVEDSFYSSFNRNGGNKRFYFIKALSNFISSHKDIRVVHNHCANYANEVMIVAKLHHIPIIIAHAHSAYTKYWNPKIFPLKSKVADLFYMLFIRRIPTYNIGCSSNACYSHFENLNNRYYLPNGIDMEVFNCSKYESKESIRGKYNLELYSTYFIFVGRFSPEKNPLFMIDVFKFINREIANSRLIIVGHGEMEEAIKKHIKDNELLEKVRLFPQDSCIPELLKASDYFVMPSLYEGLGIAIVEAQLMGLTSFASNQVPKDADLGKCKFIPLESGAIAFASMIIQYIKSGNCDNNYLDCEKVNKFDMNHVISAYEHLYLGETQYVRQYIV